MISAVALCNYFSFHHPYLVVLLGTGASAQGQAFGVSLLVGHSFVFAVSPQPGFKVGPDPAAMERGKGKKKIPLKKKKNVVKETAFTVPLRAANKAQREVSPQQSCVQHGVGSTNVIETAGIRYKAVF